MKLPLQITFRQMEPLVALEARIRELASRLEKSSGGIMRCNVIVEGPPKQGYERKRQGHTKTHVSKPHGRVCELQPQADFGRIETDDGRI